MMSYATTKATTTYGWVGDKDSKILFLIAVACKLIVATSMRCSNKFVLTETCIMFVVLVKLFGF